MGDNLLNLNPRKTELLFVHLEAPAYLLMRNHFPWRAGSQIELLLKQQVETTNGGTFGQLRLACHLELYLGQENLATVIHALVPIYLYYCNTLDVGLPLKTIWKLQLAKIAVACVLFYICQWDYITFVLQTLHCLPIRLLLQFKVLMLTWKGLYDLALSYILVHPLEWGLLV